MNLSRKIDPVLFSLVVAGSFLLLASFLVYWYLFRSPLEQRKSGTSQITQSVEEKEPNDDLAEATRIDLGAVRGVLDSDDIDSFKVEVPNGHLLRFSLVPALGADPMAIQLSDPDQKEIFYEDNISSGDEFESAKLLGNDNGGVYYWRVSLGPGAYTLQVDVESQNDGNSGGDAGARASQAVEIEDNDLFRGVIGDFDEEDWYKLQPQPGQTLTIATERDAEDIAVQLVDLEEHEIWYRDGLSATAYESFTFGDSLDSPYYFLRVADGIGGYTVSFD